jgi:hypothetical protein
MMVRTANGSMNRFDALDASAGTSPVSIIWGQIIGLAFNANGVGFLLKP